MPEESSACPLCRELVTRQIKAHPDRSADVFDCRTCGIFEIGRTTQMAMAKIGRDDAHTRALIAHIKPANRRGFLFRYPGGEQVRHEWVKGPDDPSSDK